MVDPSSSDGADLPPQRPSYCPLPDSLALVSYIGGALGSWLDEVRRDLEPSAACVSPRAHVTVLPPRPLAPGYTRNDAAGILRKLLPAQSAVEIRLGRIEVFPGTNVVYVSLDAGREPLQAMHDTLNQGPLAYFEPYPYHPHVTLVQGVSADLAETIRLEATRRWEVYTGSRRFVADPLYLVQNSDGSRWVDLERYTLAMAGYSLPR